MTPPLRIATGVLFAPDSKYRVGGFVSYSNRFLAAVDDRRDVRVAPLVEGSAEVLPPAQITAPHLHPFTPHGERLIAKLEHALRQLRPDVVHVMEWGSTGMALFEACLRVGVPYAVLVIDHKPVCAQAMLLERGTTVCEGPTSPHRCEACLKAQGWQHRSPAILQLRRDALTYYFRRAAAVIAFTPQHADEVARWLGRPRETIDVVPIAVPPAGAGYAKAPDAFRGPLRFGFIARCVPEWGLEETLEAWRLLAVDPSVAVLDVHTSHEFAEDDQLAERYADLIASGAVTVDLEPVFERLDEVHADLAALIVASRWKNNISGAGLEALERGTPVITSDRHAFYESLAPEQQALAYRFGDPASLADVLRRVIADPSLLAARSADPPPAWRDTDHVAGILDVLHRVAGRRVGPAKVQPLPVEGDVALLVARGDWTTALDAYLAGELAVPAGGLVLVGDVVGFAAVEEAVLERLDAAGIAPEDCPPLTLMESLDPLSAVPAASLLLCGADRIGADVAALCGVRVSGTGRPIATP